MWPIQLAFRLLILCRTFLRSLTLSNMSSFLTWSVKLNIRYKNVRRETDKKFREWKRDYLKGNTSSNNGSVFDTLFRKDRNIKIINLTAGLFPCGSRLSISGKNTGASFVTHRRGKKCLQSFGGKSVGKRYFEDLGVDGYFILKWILRIFTIYATLYIR
jgi:hypothetical protein